MNECPACKNGEENQMAHMVPGGCLYDDSGGELDVSNTVIYCDMDGVLADFVTGAIDLCSSIGWSRVKEGKGNYWVTKLSHCQNTQNKIL